MLFDERQLQKKFKHAGDFGITGQYTPDRAEAFRLAIEAHLEHAEVIVGDYRGSPARFYVNRVSGLVVIETATGSFWTGWKLNPGQLRHLIEDNTIGGGAS